MSVRLTTFFLRHVKNLTAPLPYLFAALVRRLSEAHKYDPEMNVFIFDSDAHEAYKRGRATSRPASTNYVCLRMLPLPPPRLQTRQDRAHPGGAQCGGTK